MHPGSHGGPTVGRRVLSARVRMCMGNMESCKPPGRVAGALAMTLRHRRRMRRIYTGMEGACSGLGTFFHERRRIVARSLPSLRRRRCMSTPSEQA